MVSRQGPPEKPSVTADHTSRRLPTIPSAAASTQAASGTPMPQLAIDVPVVPGVPFEIVLTDFLMNAQDTISIASDPVVGWLLLDTAKPPEISGIVPIDFLGSFFNLTATFSGSESTYSVLFSLVIFRTVAFLTVYKSDVFTIDLVPLLWKIPDYVQSIDVNPNVDWLTLDVAERTISAHVPPSAGRAVNITLHAITELPDMDTPGVMGELLSRDTDEAYMMWLNLDILDRPTNSSTTMLGTSTSQATNTIDAVTESGLDSSATASPSRTYVSISSGSFSLASLSSPVSEIDNASLSFSVVAPRTTIQGSVVSVPAPTSTWSTNPASNSTMSQQQSDEAQSIIITSTSTDVPNSLISMSPGLASTTPASTNVLVSSLGTEISNSEVAPLSASVLKSAGPSAISLNVATTQSLIITTNSPSFVSQLSHTGDTPREVTSSYGDSTRVSIASPSESTGSETHSSSFVRTQSDPPRQSPLTLADISSTSVSSSQPGVSSVTGQSEVSLPVSTLSDYTTMTSPPGLGSSGSVSSRTDSASSTSPLVASGISLGSTSTEVAVSNQLPGDSTPSIFSTPSIKSVASSVTQSLPEESPTSSMRKSMLQATRSTTHHRHTESSNLVAVRSTSTSSNPLVSSTSIPTSTVSQMPLPTAFVFAQDQTLTIDLAPYLANPHDTLLSASTAADWLQLDLNRELSTLSASSNQTSGNAAVIVRARGVAGNIYTFSLQLTVTGQTSSMMSSSETSLLSSTSLVDTQTGDYTSLTSQSGPTRFIGSSSSVLLPGVTSKLSMISNERSSSSFAFYSSLDVHTGTGSALVSEASSLITSTVLDMSIPPSTSPRATELFDSSTAQDQLTTQVHMSSLEPRSSPLPSDLASPSMTPADSTNSESSILPSSSGLSSIRAQTPTPTPPVFEVNQGQTIRIDMNPYLESPADILMDGSPDWVTSDPDDGTVLVAVPADQTPGNITVTVMVQSGTASNTYTLYVYLIVLQSRTSSSMTAASQTASSNGIHSGPLSVYSSTATESVTSRAISSSEQAENPDSKTQSSSVSTQTFVSTSSVFSQGNGPPTSSVETLRVPSSSGTKLLSSTTFATMQSTSAAPSSSMSTSIMTSSMSESLLPSSYKSMSEALFQTQSQTSGYTGFYSSLGLSTTSVLAPTLPGSRDSSTSTPTLSSVGQLAGPQTSSIQQNTNISLQTSTSEITSTFIAPNGTYTSMTTSDSSQAVSELSSSFISTSQSLGVWNSSTSLTTYVAGYTGSMIPSSSRSSLVGSSDSSEASSATSMFVIPNITSIQDRSTSTMSPLLSSISGGEISSKVSPTIQASSLVLGVSTSGFLTFSSTSQYPDGLSTSAQDMTGRTSIGQASNTQKYSTEQLASSAAQTSLRSTSQTSLSLSSTQSSTVPSLSHFQNETSSQISKSSSNTQALTSGTTQFSATTTIQTTSATQMASASVQGSQLNASMASSLLSTSPSVGSSSRSSASMPSIQTTYSSPFPPRSQTPTPTTSTGSPASQQSLSISAAQTQQGSSVLSTSPAEVTTTPYATVSSLSTSSSLQSSTLPSYASSQNTSILVRDLSSAQLPSSQTTQAQSSSPTLISSVVGSGTSVSTNSIMTRTQALFSAALTSTSSLPFATSQITAGISSSSATASAVIGTPTTTSQLESSTNQFSASVAQVTSSINLSSTILYQNLVSSSQKQSPSGQSSSFTSKFTSSSQAVVSISQVLSSTTQFPTSLSITASSSSQSLDSSTQAIASSGQLSASSSTNPPSSIQVVSSTIQTIPSSSQGQSSSSFIISSSNQGTTSTLSSLTTFQASSSRTAFVLNTSSPQSSASSTVSQVFSVPTLSSADNQSMRISTSSQQSTTTSENQSSLSSPSTPTSTSTLGNSLQARSQTSSMTPRTNVSTTFTTPNPTSLQTTIATVAPSTVINKTSSIINIASLVTSTTSTPTKSTQFTALAVSTATNTISSTTNITPQFTQQATTVTTAAAAAASSSSSSSILCYDDFNSGTFSNWTTYDGTWNASSKAFQETDYVLGAKALFTPGCQPYSNFTYDGYITINNVSASAGTGDGDAGFIFRVTGAANGINAYNGYYAYINRNNYTGLGVVSQGWKGLTTTSMAIAVGTTYHMRVTVIGANIRVYVTDMVNPKITWSDSTWSTGLVGMRVMYTIAGWDNMTVESQIA